MSDPKEDRTISATEVRRRLGPGVGVVVLSMVAVSSIYNPYDPKHPRAQRYRKWSESEVEAALQHPIIVHVRQREALRQTARVRNRAEKERMRKWMEEMDAQSAEAGEAASSSTTTTTVNEK